MSFLPICNFGRANYIEKEEECKSKYLFIYESFLNNLKDRFLKRTEDCSSAFLLYIFIEQRRVPQEVRECIFEIINKIVKNGEKCLFLLFPIFLYNVDHYSVTLSTIIPRTW